MRSDVLYGNGSEDMGGYARHILESCAYSIVPETPGIDAPKQASALVQGYADRYGGAGIGHNGGSGRAAYVNGYHVKGIGKTPLVGDSPEEHYSNGECLLEECIREAIFSEVVSDEFPWSAVPTLAIIAIEQPRTTGAFDTKQRALLVRPSFIRPAHFERALGFVNSSAATGRDDQHRLTGFFSAAQTVLGRETVLEAYHDIWLRWAEQLAYSFVHRLPHGSDTTSNISIDGRLLDFGGMSAVPSWADIAISLGRRPYSTQFHSIVQAIRSLSYYFGRHFDDEFRWPMTVSAMIESAWSRYKESISREVLACFGVDHGVAEEFVRSAGGNEVYKICANLFVHYQKVSLDMLDETRRCDETFDAFEVWKDNPPEHLRPIRRILSELLSNSTQLQRAKLASKCALMPRPWLYRSHLRQSITAELEKYCDYKAMHVELVSEYIDNQIAMSSKKHPD